MGNFRSIMARMLFSCFFATLPSLPKCVLFYKNADDLSFQPNNESSLPQRYEWTQHLDQYALHQLHVHCGYSSTMTSNLFPCWKTVWQIWALKSNKDLQLPKMQIENPAIKSLSAMRPCQLICLSNSVFNWIRTKDPYLSEKFFWHYEWPPCLL